MKIGNFILGFTFTLRVIACSHVSTRCPVRWVERLEGNSCYRFWPTRKKSWKVAQATCKERDGNLLKLNSKEEKEWIIDQIENYPVHYKWWIGLHRHPKDGSIWHWTDGTSRNETNNFIQWRPGEQTNDDGSEDCLEIRGRGLYDTNCDEPLPFICERPKVMKFEQAVVLQYLYSHPSEIRHSSGTNIRPGTMVDLCNARIQYMQQGDSDLPMQCDIDNGWDEVSSGYCYKFFGDKIADEEALFICKDEDADLLTIHDANEQRHITDFLDHEGNTTKVWLDYMYQSGWINTQTRDKVSSNWWFGDVPDSETVLHNDTFCSVMDTSVSDINNWKAASCDSINSFMCKKLPGMCPYGYIQHKTTCYLLNTQDFFTWNEARGFCNLRSTTLVEVKNDSDWYYVLNMLRSQYTLTEINSVWLGLTGQDVDNLKWDSGDAIGEFIKAKVKLAVSQTGTQCGFLENWELINTTDSSQWKFGDCSESRGTICTIPVNQFVITPPPEKPRHECPEGYTLNGIKCYRWNPDDPVDWYSAREKCANEGADLVTIQSEEDQQFISSIIQGEIWIGLNDRHKEGSFNWLDTTSEVDYQYWLESEPNNVEIGSQYSENCVAMLYLPGKENHGKWSDYPCSYKARFVCQTPAEWNIALGTFATQSSTSNDSDVAHKAIDGCSRRKTTSTCCARTGIEDNPWWMLDLGTYYPIGKVVIHPQTDYKCLDCMSLYRNFRLFVSNTSTYNTADETDMVYQEQRDEIPVVIILNLRNVSVGRYVRIDIPTGGSTLALCEVKIFRGVTLQKSVNPTNAKCITDSTKWDGDIRHTVSGRTCQPWVEDVPHKHSCHDKPFVDGTDEDAENFCRDPLGEGQPWCYTSDPDVRWEFCPVPHCYNVVDYDKTSHTSFTAEVQTIDSEVVTDEVLNNTLGWREDIDTGDSYWQSEESLTWADAKSVCESVGASLLLPSYKDDITFVTGKVLNHRNGTLLWLGMYFEVGHKYWVSVKDTIPSFIVKELGNALPKQTMCVVVDKSGHIQAKHCFDRNMFSCFKSGSYMKYRTWSDGQYKHVPSSYIKTNTEDSLITYTITFEYKGCDGATLFLNQTTNKQPGDDYEIRFGGKFYRKSFISKLGSSNPNFVTNIPAGCDVNEYKGYWVQWTNGNSNGDTIKVGSGTDVGRNIFMQWTDQAGITASSVSVATIMKTSKTYQGHWRFKKEIKESTQSKAAVNLALGKPAKQSSTNSWHTGPEKAVDGCKSDTYHSRCISHTKRGDFEPWWEVDLGHVYPIREVVIYRRGPECCSDRLGYFKLIISMLSDSTHHEDIVYESKKRHPPYTIRIATDGKAGRYVKVYIPDRKEVLELAEVEVFEDLDSSRCGKGWFDYETDATCYKFSDNEMSWKDAKYFCEGLSAAMTVPKTPKEQLLLYEKSLPISSSRSVWLGLQDLNSDGTFRAFDGSPLVYTDWAISEPDDFATAGYCAYLSIDMSDKSGKWNVQHCTTHLRAVCKKRELPTTISASTTQASTTSKTTIKTTTVENAITVSQGACDSGWVYSPVSSSCLRLILHPKINFYDAAAKCINMNSRLTSIKSRTEQRLIAEILKKNNVAGSGWQGLWCAGYDEHEEGNWKWFMDDIEWHSSIKWTPGQPSNTRDIEDCAIIRTASDNFVNLNDAPCSKLSVVQGFMCKYNLDVKKCKDGWVYNGETDACYRYEMESPETWNDARKKCSDNGGILATIASKSEQLFMKALVADSKTRRVRGAWIGAHNMQDGLFQWIDGATWIRGLWAPDQPNNWKGNQNCVTIVVDAIQDALGQIKDDFCTDKYPYICKIKRCSTGWEKFEENCYLFSLSNRGWEDAKAYCESEGARLLIVEDEREHTYIREKLRDVVDVPQIWIGAHFDAKYGEHRWIDGSAMTVDGWGPGRPGLVKGCVSYLQNADYLWNTHEECIDTKAPFICEKVSISAAGLTEPPSVPSSTVKITTTTKGVTSPVLSQTTVPSTEEREIGKCGLLWEIDPNSETCYKFVIELATWTDAQRKCKDEGGNLVSIVSEQEQSYITGRLQGMSMLPEAMWIGASDTDIEAGWKWTDEQPFAYLNWARGEADNYEDRDSTVGTSEGQDCAAVVTGDKHYFGQWNDLPCSGKRGYICKRKLATEETITSKPVPDIESNDILEIYLTPKQKEFKLGPDLYEMGVRPVGIFKFAVKAPKDSFILLHNKKTDFKNDAYKIIIGGWGNSRSVLRGARYDQTGILSPHEFRWFWISWNKTTITVGKSEEVGKNVFLTYSGIISDINYVSLCTHWGADGHYRIPKGDKYYGCSGVGWLGYRDACFLVVEEKKDWNEANNYCHKEGAELASIVDEEEQKFLFSQLPQDSYCFNTWNNDTRCNIWAKRGECDRNYAFMARHCHLACKHCMHNCRDKYYSSSKCLEWARLGECDDNPKWMVQNCAMSCGICQGAPTRGYWIGLQSRGMDQSYIWSDRSYVRYTNWDSHQPLWFNLRPRSCVAMYTQTGKWNDGQCTDPLSGFICRQPKMILPIATTSSFEIGCPMENGYGYGAYCYVYVREQKSWSDAQKNCNTLGGYLAYIGDAYTQAFVDSELQNLLQDYWIGLSVTKGSWTWDGKEQSKLTMTHFHKSVRVEEVTDGCFAMTTIKPVGLWQLYPDCSFTLPSICQIPREGFTTVPSTMMMSTAPLQACADTWQPYGQYCYKVSDERQQWRVAQQICTHYGSSLVSIHNNEENNAVAEIAILVLHPLSSLGRIATRARSPDGTCIPLHDLIEDIMSEIISPQIPVEKTGTRDVFWIGLHDTEIEGVFIWEDGSPTDFSAWVVNNPDNAAGAEDCTELLNWNKLWNDAICYITKRYICKIPRGKSVHTDPPNIDSFPACDENNPEDGWVSYGEYCYLRKTHEVLNWHDANNYCRNKRSELASVHSKEEHGFLIGMNLMAKGVSWIGFNDLDLDSTFSWSDGSVVDYTAWDFGQPQQSDENCVLIHRYGPWHDYPCTDRKPFICKKRKDVVTMTTTSTVTRGIEGGCPSGFDYTFGNKCYSFSGVRNTTHWGDAKERCRLVGGHLPSIQSELEKDFIALNVYGISNSVWLGLNDLDDDGRYKWLDNSLLDYANWAPNEPSSSIYDTFAKELCVEMWTGADNFGLWNDVKCPASRGYVCSCLKDSSLPVPDSQCPEGYIFLRKSCYKVSSTKQSWNESLRSCSSEGGNMVSIVQVPDNVIIKVLLATSGQAEVWIGGVANEGKVHWKDGSTFPITVPNSVRRGCLYSSGTSWSSAPCTDSRASVCRITKGTSTASSNATTAETALNTTMKNLACRNSSWLLYEGYCYTTVYELTTFMGTKCSKYGMSLASINSAEENLQIISWILHQQRTNQLIVDPHFWIGLALQTGDLPVNRWTDGGSVKYSNIVKDKGGQQQGCVLLMVFTGQWQIVSCRNKHSYLCKGPADEATTLWTTSSTISDVTTAKLSQHGPNIAKGYTGLVGGQIAGIVVGILGFLALLVVVVYIVRCWTSKNKPGIAYNMDVSSLGFGNALYNKSQESVAM